MSTSAVVKLILDGDLDIPEAWDTMLDAASIQGVNGDGHSYYIWSDEDWSSLSHEDTSAFDEWTDEHALGSEDGTDAKFQYVGLVCDDTYMDIRGNIHYGIRVAFI
jgi:hypothetical protein